MNRSTKNKLRSIIGITALSTLTIHCINQAVFGIATMKDRLNARFGSYYKWRLGDIYYRKQGTGKPLLLIHDLQAASSSYEWNRIVRQLSEEHTVYTIDLIGCGRSEKPKFTYTNYLYVQLICDFIKNVITHKCDVVATGMSASFVTMACNNNPELFDRIMMINPQPLNCIRKAPGKRSKTVKLLIETPVIGTLIYNLCTNRMALRKKFRQKYFYNKKKCSTKNISAYHEAAHLGKANARFLYASLKGNYVNLNISSALRQINNSITILCGTDWKYAQEVLDAYTKLNPSIEKCIIQDTRYLPQLENPSSVIAQIRIYMS